MGGPSQVHSGGLEDIPGAAFEMIDARRDGGVQAVERTCRTDSDMIGTLRQQND
ncbi:MAG: hypothetical protein VCF07_04105 [Nitrospinota bacterium]